MSSIYGLNEQALSMARYRLLEMLEQKDRIQFDSTGEHLYDHVVSRIKSDESMREKCRRRGFPETWESALVEMRDALGIRVVCSFIDDIYETRKALSEMEGVRIIEEKDYVGHAKDNGYRSYHLILEIVNPLRPDPKDGPEKLYAEVQVRTIAMDSWAALEHKMKYKKDVRNQEMIVSELKRCADELASCDLSMQTIRDLIRNAK
ncbi:MAG: GTP pyrophosphokinase family protein [Lachnospiraceae bacterium]|nr:GTP pyrophosphokinase family protein [Lachnospiraceae bacterium]